MTSQQTIRNFAIIAHIDHGKSTLSDRFLELTGTIEHDKLVRQEQFLDQNPISRERGITIKLAPVRMKYRYHESEYALNLIDTPGHVDFSYEVSRTLAACEGAILLVDATKGVQAQTVAHLREARKQNLVIIPAINKIDAPMAMPEKTVKQLELLGFAKEQMSFISARTGEGVQDLLNRVVDQLPAPIGVEQNSLRALVFDAVYDEHRGVIAFVRIVDGSLKTGDSIRFMQSDERTNVLDCGIFTPSLLTQGQLTTGAIGYVVTGIKDIRKARVGDTITVFGPQAASEPLPGYSTPKPMVFFGIYPRSTDELLLLRQSIEKLALMDASITYHEEYSSFLGSGFRVGFLGLLHADIFKQRLVREFHVDPLFTLPQVLYEKNAEGNFEEPFMRLTILVPTDYVGGVMTVCQKKRGELTGMEYQDTNVTLTYEMPYASFLKGLSPDLKSVSAGYASIDYETIGYRTADLVPLEVRVNDVPVDVLSEYAYRDEAEYLGREKVAKLKEALPRQQIRQILQCAIYGKIVAREDIPPYRKDVLAKMSGGDRTRKDKLLEAQKKGKKKMQTISKIDIPQEALFGLLNT